MVDMVSLLICVDIGKFVFSCFVNTKSQNGACYNLIALHGLVQLYFLYVILSKTKRHVTYCILIKLGDIMSYV